MSVKLFKDAEPFRGKSMGTEVSIGNSENDIISAIRQSAQENTNQAGRQFVQRQLDVQPTLTVRPGWPLKILVHKDLVLDSYPQIPRR
jgi:type IV secretion system protein TrbI